MDAIPAELNGARVVAIALVDGTVRPTSNTTHRVAGSMLGPAHALAICTHPDETGVCLFYCDRAWQVLADTWRSSVAEAKEQAEFEYADVSGAWKDAV
jgi:hypothetical protein